MNTGTGSINLETLNDLHSDLTQHFWFNSNAGAAYGTGVHITLTPQGDFMNNPTGQNILINTDGVSIRNGIAPLMVLDDSSLDFNVVTDAEQGTYKNIATFGAITRVGGDDSYSAVIEAGKFGIESDDGVILFNISPSGNPTAESYQRTDTTGSIVGNQNTLETRYTPTNGTNITVQISKRNSWSVGTLIFTAGTSATKSWSDCTVNYVAPRTFTITGTNLLSMDVTYTTQSDIVDLGMLQFGSRRDGDVGNNSITLGNELVAPYSYQTVVGKHNVAVDAPFVVGAGTPEENKNAFTVGWNGDIRSVSSVRPDKSILYNRAVVYDCKSHFTVNSTGMVVKNAYVALCGRMCQLVIVFTNTGSVASGGNFIVGSFNGSFENKTAPPMPRYGVNGASYYGKTSMSGGFGMTGTLTIRNASPAALTIGSSNAASMSFTYIVEDDFWTP